MNDFLKEVLALGAEIEKADSAVQISMAINDAKIAYEKHLEQLTLLRVSNWVAYKDAKFLKCGKEYLIYVNDYVTTDEWLDDGLGFREHGNDIIKVSELPKPPC